MEVLCFGLCPLGHQTCKDTVCYYFCPVFNKWMIPINFSRTWMIKTVQCFYNRVGGTMEACGSESEISGLEPDGEGSQTWAFLYKRFAPRIWNVGRYSDRKITGNIWPWVIPQRPARHTQYCYNFDTLNERTPAGFTIRPLKDDSYTASTKKYVLKF